MDPFSSRLNHIPLSLLSMMGSTAPLYPQKYPTHPYVGYISSDGHQIQFSIVHFQRRKLEIRRIHCILYIRSEWISVYVFQTLVWGSISSYPSNHLNHPVAIIQRKSPTANCTLPPSVGNSGTYSSNCTLTFWHALLILFCSLFLQENSDTFIWSWSFTFWFAFLALTLSISDILAATPKFPHGIVLRYQVDLDWHRVVLFVGHCSSLLYSNSKCSSINSLILVLNSNNSSHSLLSHPLEKSFKHFVLSSYRSILHLLDHSFHFFFDHIDGLMRIWWQLLATLKFCLASSYLRFDVRSSHLLQILNSSFKP